MQVAGTNSGVTAAQLDIKLAGVPVEVEPISNSACARPSQPPTHAPLQIICEAVDRSFSARQQILARMQQVIAAPRPDLKVIYRRHPSESITHLHTHIHHTALCAAKRSFGAHDLCGPIKTRFSHRRGRGGHQVVTGLFDCGGALALLTVVVRRSLWALTATSKFRRKEKCVIPRAMTHLLTPASSGGNFRA